jgi:hypothetical protein
MRSTIIDHLARGGRALDPLVRNAVQRWGKRRRKPEVDAGAETRCRPARARSMSAAALRRMSGFSLSPTASQQLWA